jgi:hypothetical protein
MKQILKLFSIQWELRVGVLGLELTEQENSNAVGASICSEAQKNPWMANI